MKGERNAASGKSHSPKVSTNRRETPKNQKFTGNVKRRMCWWLISHLLRGLVFSSCKSDTLNKKVKAKNSSTKSSTFLKEMSEE